MVGILVFVLFYYYYFYDYKWWFEGVLEKLMYDICMFDCFGVFIMDGFEGFGVDWLEEYKLFINDGEIVVVSFYKVYGLELNDFMF